MAFDSLSGFLAMGGHGVYVWAAWGVTALLLLGVVLHAHAERRALLRHLRRRVRREQHHGASGGATTPVSHQEGHARES
ncbi:heme exporter protein CcmD [Halomonas daqiaonensis]|uniref:Heme exporter protein D n=1 Tax=Halomonas daqiaonensis TaxID=650850 RepID=A0A1H7WAD6_9GAMM|nr:heme exporter protein CcmD [Halomonas daqiaonensis]SEM18526.1 heme exporter protein D [Halomonas daqiaonensis]